MPEEGESISPDLTTTCRQEAIQKTMASSIRRQYPFTMVYCLDGTTQDINTREIYNQNPTLGYITFTADKIIIDNREIYHFKYEENGVRVYEGNTLYNGNVPVTPIIFADKDFNDVTLFISVGDRIGKSAIYLMEINDFQVLCNRCNNNMNVGQFIDNAQQGSPSSSKGPNINRSARFDSRYGYKDCYSCHGTGTCQTCNGRGIQHNSFGMNDSGCANCHRDSNGRRTGKCSTCQGTGKVYGLR